MPLENTTIPDREGAALYAISSRDTATFRNLERLLTEVTTLCKNQTVLLEPTSQDAQRVLDFYDILPEQLPVAMIVRDDDSLVELWYGTSIPTSASDIAYRLSQTSS